MAGPRAAVAVALAVALAGIAACSSGGPAAGPSAPPRPTPAAGPATADATADATDRSPGGGVATPAGTPSTSPLDACVRRVLAGLDVDRRARQLIMVGIPAADPASGAALVRDARVGGVFLAGRTSAPLARVRRGVDAVQAASAVPVLVAVDQEGGQVRTLQGPDAPAMPSALRQGELDPADLRRAAARWGAALRSAGVSMNLAPVADTVSAARAPGNPPIGAFDREYGHMPGVSGPAVAAVVSGLQSAGVLATLKHFPGLGRVRLNTDVSTGAVDERADVDDPYLQPFRDGIAVGSAAVMISSAAYPRLDPERVAAFSRPVVTGLLRERLGFDGLVVSDDLGQARAVADVAPRRRATRFVGAGGDLVLTVRSGDVEPMAAALAAAAASSAPFRARVDEAAGHVLTAKARAGLLGCG